MATARDTLVTELGKLFTGPYTERATDLLSGVLDRFRIQSKSGPNSKAGTAREILHTQLVKLWREASQIEPNGLLGKIISQYRMQLKMGTEKKEESKPPKSVVSTTKTQKPKVRTEPVAGGPQRRQGVRGECPKCHSMGVVLARSYSGDEYFSCIYCGYQSHRASVDFEFDLPLAAELLNRRFDDKDTPAK